MTYSIKISLLLFVIGFAFGIEELLLPLLLILQGVCYLFGVLLLVGPHNAPSIDSSRRIRSFRSERGLRKEEEDHLISFSVPFFFFPYTFIPQTSPQSVLVDLFWCR